MTNWLLDHGSDPNSRCDLDSTPTSYAMYEASQEISKMVFLRGAQHNGQLLPHAVLTKKPDALELVRWLLGLGAPINHVKYENDPKSYAKRQLVGLGTPLHRAAESGNVEVVGYLLSVGADPLKLDGKQHTPRHWAEERSHREVANVLTFDGESTKCTSTRAHFMVLR